MADAHLQETGPRRGWAYSRAHGTSPTGTPLRTFRPETVALRATSGTAFSSKPRLTGGNSFQAGDNRLRQVEAHRPEALPSLWESRLVAAASQQPTCIAIRHPNQLYSLHLSPGEEQQEMQ